MKSTWIAAVVLLTAACGGSGETPESQPTQSATAATSAAPSETAEAPSDEAALEDAYRTYVRAFLTGDGATAYALLSERCRDSTQLSEFASAAESAAELYGEVDYTLNSVTIDGDEGHVDATYAVEALNSGGGSVWIRENGEWHSDKCG